jgi:hypothetical protein
MLKRSAKGDAMGASKKARASTGTMDNMGVPEKRARDTGHKVEVEIFNVFTYDMDTLECPVCNLLFDSHIYMVSI